MNAALGIAPDWSFEDQGRFLPEHSTAVSMLDQLLHHATGVVGLSDRAGFVASSDGSRPLQSGQDLAKPQGLVSQLCAAHLHRRPTQIWMALDTIRAYLVAPDAAEMVVYAMHRLRHGRV